MPGIGTIDRRAAVAGAVAGVTALALPYRASAGRVVVQRGVVGGGLVEFGESEASFSLFASRMTFTPENIDVVVGSVLWVDATAGMTMASTTITDYFPPEPQPEQGISRQIIGTMRVNDEQEFPFDLLVVDLDIPGSGQDSVFLTVGDDARTGVNATPASGYGFTYTAAGPVVSGDIQELDLDIDPGDG